MEKLNNPLGGKDNITNEEIRYEGYIFKILKSKEVKQYYYKLNYKDLFAYKTENNTNNINTNTSNNPNNINTNNQNSNTNTNTSNNSTANPICSKHFEFKNLSGVFFNKEEPVTIKDILYYCFSLEFKNKTKVYFIDNIVDYNSWCFALKSATGFNSFLDTYELIEDIGKGKFGTVKLGINKNKSEKVAIKIINKKNILDFNTNSRTNFEKLVKSEIDALKICTHPNIIRLQEICENQKYLYLIMDYCPGGTLIQYLEKKKFNLSEKFIKRIVKSLLEAVDYLHSFGIIHRDIKPQNIMLYNNSVLYEDNAEKNSNNEDTMTTNTNNINSANLNNDYMNLSIRLIDFGLSKIIGPKELCNEPVGSLGYVAPEIIASKLYDFSVDLWSIGIVTYLLIAKTLPFDSVISAKEIAEKTLYDEVDFSSSAWDNVSSNAKTFVENLLNKDPSKRYSVSSALDSAWMRTSKSSGFTRISFHQKSFKYSFL